MAKKDLVLAKPLLNVAGFLGFAPDPYGLTDPNSLGAFITNPISLGARSSARGARLVFYPGGFLLHTGHPNPGLKTTIRRYATRWQRSHLPTVVHLLANGVDETAGMVRNLENIPGVAGLELGLPPDIDPAGLTGLIRAASGELPLIVQIPVDRAREFLAVITAQEVLISLGAPRGTWSEKSGKIIEGRLYGPALFPSALTTVRMLVSHNITVIGAGGIYRPWQVEAMLAAGAMAVQLDAILWRGGGLSNL